MTAPGAPAPITRARARLSSRLYIVGLVQLLLVAVAAVAIGFVMARLQMRDARDTVVRLQHLSSDPAALDAALQALRENESLLVSIYDDGGGLVATNVRPPLHLPRWAHGSTRPSDDRPPPSPPPPRRREGDWLPPPFGRPPDHGPGGPHHGPPPFDSFISFTVRGGEGTAVTRHERPRPSVVPPILTLIFGLGVFGAGAWLTARWIARPLQRLSRAARSLGQGDLTARAGLERTDELGEVGHAFDEMAERIQALLAAEKELLGSVAHELRTPLARIRVALEIAAEGDAGAAHASLAEIAVDLSELETIVDDILTAARLEAAAGRAQRADFPMHLEEIAPESMVERAAERLRERHPQRKLDASVGSDLGLIEADPVLLRRVLDNLLENAHKYSPDPATPIAMSAAGTADDVTFQVSDTGMGIPEEDLPRIFTAFFRGDRSRSRGTGGVGLGLTLVKRIVEAHGGTVSAKSAPGVGTTITVVVPRRRSTPSQSPGRGRNTP